MINPLVSLTCPQTLILILIFKNVSLKLTSCIESTVSAELQRPIGAFSVSLCVREKLLAKSATVEDSFFSGIPFKDDELA